MSAHLPHSEAARAVAFAIDKLARLRADDALVHPQLVAAARDCLAEKLDELVRQKPEPLFVDPSLTEAPHIVRRPGEPMPNTRRAQGDEQQLRDAFEDLGFGAACVNCRRLKQPHELACPACFPPRLVLPCLWAIRIDDVLYECQGAARHDDEHECFGLDRKNGGVMSVKWTDDSANAFRQSPMVRMLPSRRQRERIEELEREVELLRGENAVFRGALFREVIR